MKSQHLLANGLLEAHPEDAARVLDTLPLAEVLAVLSATSAPVAVGTLRRLAPDLEAAVLSGLEPEHATAVVKQLSLDQAAAVLRRLEAAKRETLLESLGGELAHSLRSLLRFPLNSAGALMDPDVLALPGDLSAQEAIAHMRGHPENVAYNLYLVDREQVLIGVLNLRELLLARRKDPLKSISSEQLFSISARAGRHEILTHPAWRNSRSVPVVDSRGTYLGAVRYQTLRKLEEELRRAGPDHATATASALGDLYSTGIGGVFAALASPLARPVAEREEHEP